MSVKSKIYDGTGQEYSAQVTPENALLVATTQPKASDRSPEQLTAVRLYRSYFADDDGNSDLNVDGSVSVRKFRMKSTPDEVFWLQSVRFIMSGEKLAIGTVDFRQFGLAAPSPGLTNGIRFYARQGGKDVEIFAEPVKMLGDFLNWCDDFTTLTNAIAPGEDFLSVDFQLEAPVAIPPATVDELIIEIRDDLTAIGLFRAVARGFQEAV